MPIERGARTEVLIVGAGPTGLMAGALLRRFGIEVRILDKSAGPAKESRAFGIQARTMELFQFMGLAERFLDRGLMASGVQIVVDGAPAATLDFTDIGRRDTPYSFLLMLPQSETEAILAEDLKQQGGSVEYGADVLGLTQGDPGVTVTVQRDGAAPETIEAAYVIGADGAHSIVRKALGLSFEGAAYPQTFLLADCRIEWPLGYDRVSLLLHGRHFAAYIPLKGKTIGRVLVMDPADTGGPQSIEQQGTSAVSLDEVAAAFRESAGVDVTLSDAVWTSRYRVHHRGVNRYREGRVFVAGDAAHIHSPAGGQGMNTGLQDVANLCWKLAFVLRNGAPDALLDTYHDERWPIGRTVLERTDAMFTRIATPGKVFSVLRNAVLPLVAGPLANSTTLRAKAFHFVSQLGIRYEPNGFVREAASDAAPRAWRNGLVAGHRAPDGRIQRTVNVFDLFDPTRFTLLAFARDPLDESEIARISGALIEAEQHAAKPLKAYLIARTLIGRDKRLIQAESDEALSAYGLGPDVPQALFLIRPDGYIAYRADRLGFEELAGMLETFGPLEFSPPHPS